MQCCKSATLQKQKQKKPKGGRKKRERKQQKEAVGAQEWLLLPNSHPTSCSLPATPYLSEYFSHHTKREGKARCIYEGPKQKNVGVFWFNLKK